MRKTRRDFLKTAGAGALASVIPVQLNSENENLTNKYGNIQPGSNMIQSFHPDFRSYYPGIECYFFGNGLIIAALQTTSDQDEGTHCGLFVMSPEHFSRRASTLLFHPERGVEHTRFYLNIGNKHLQPEYKSTRVYRDNADDIPILVVEWESDQFIVREKFHSPVNIPAIIRDVEIINNGNLGVDITGTFLLYPNLMLFDEYYVDRNKFTLNASGYLNISMFSPDATRVGDRNIFFDLKDFKPGESRSVSIITTLNLSREEYEKISKDEMHRETTIYWKSKNSIDMHHDGLNHLYNVSKSSICATIAQSGKMDAGIWEYNLEWVRDQSMAAVASCMINSLDRAESILTRILKNSVDESGSTTDASRSRTIDMAELDQNGQLLYALWTHWVWSGEDNLIKNYWNKIQKVADYVLNSECYDSHSGLVKNSREFWERNSNHGVEEGYENAYQLWDIIGLEKISRMAAHLNLHEESRRWQRASALMKKSFLGHPKYSLVEEGRFIKRRGAGGDVQRIFEPPDRNALIAGMPLATEKSPLCDPDTSSVLPIVFEIVDPKSSLAANTLQDMEKLWNQRWDIGGYGRYNVLSEPDSPGPWPFASLFVARAYLESGNHDRVWRILDWMLKVQGGKGGAWWEFYGERPTPPLPPVGIVVWTWAELIMLFVNHIIGIRPQEDSIIIRPKLLKKLENLDASFTIRDQKISLAIKKQKLETFAVVAGKKNKMPNGTLIIPYPENDISVEIFLKE
jgi:hypothetical protein